MRLHREYRFVTQYAVVGWWAMGVSKQAWVINFCHWNPWMSLWFTIFIKLGETFQRFYVAFSNCANSGHLRKGHYAYNLPSTKS